MADDLKSVVQTISPDNDGEDELMDDPTPRKAGKGKGKGKATTKVYVVVDSPPNRRPTQRLRTNEAGDAVDASPMTKAEARAWVATGAVCLN